jgi:hypothetical protein
MIGTPLFAALHKTLRAQQGHTVAPEQLGGLSEKVNFGCGRKHRALADAARLPQLMLSDVTELASLPNAA